MTVTTSVSDPTVRERRSPDEFDQWVTAIRRHVATHAGQPLFLTSPRRWRTDESSNSPLFDAFLDSLDGWVARQTHRCHCCHRFLDKYGSLVTIDENGNTKPLLWSVPVLEVPPMYRQAQSFLASFVSCAPLRSVFLSTASQLGPDREGSWTHLSVPNPTRHAVSLLKTDAQLMAEKNQEREMLWRAMDEFTIVHARQAVEILRTDQLYRSEKVLGVAEWFLGVHEASVSHGHRRRGIIWRAAAMAPAGFCHVRSTVIGTLLEDIQRGLSFQDIKQRFAEKMNPTQYRRPTAAPSEGNIKQAEEIVSTLHTRGSLQRRFAKLEDLVTVWKPAPPALQQKTETGGVFDHLRGAGKDDLMVVAGAPATTMTWEKFARTVLPTADSIECQTPPGLASFMAFVTAQIPDSPPIVQWDREDRRNPVTWYMCVGGSPASRWGLVPNEWRRVPAITTCPAHWDEGRAMSNHAKMVVLVLDGAKDNGYDRGGGLFPEHLKSEYHPVRRTIEAHMATSVILGSDEATACGVTMQANVPGSWGSVLRVTSGHTQALYRIDRWD